MQYIMQTCSFYTVFPCYIETTVRRIKKSGGRITMAAGSEKVTAKERESII